MSLKCKQISHLFTTPFKLSECKMQNHAIVTLFLKALGGYKKCIRNFAIENNCCIITGLNATLRNDICYNLWFTLFKKQSVKKLN